jgi:hypothetical protein
VRERNRLAVGALDLPSNAASRAATKSRMTSPSKSGAPSGLVMLKATTFALVRTMVPAGSLIAVTMSAGAYPSARTETSTTPRPGTSSANVPFASDIVATSVVLSRLGARNTGSKATTRAFAIGAPLASTTVPVIAA